MFFRIKNSNKPYALLKAYRFITLYKASAAEINLDRYCIEKYKKSLKQICHGLLMHTKFNTIDNDIIVTFKTKKDDDLAALITYGNGKLQGSDILKFAFGRK